ncbi:MAG: bifunctional 5,10-methylenetetrahydrofolate dehydrogenase/5,10-methenyltetrahydrofolate cyclohydrolase [Rickettsiaceae bacterium]|nr:bifunctional 5,10-methylenetetrahydrofolate dehydrogenase/5,10-methenyltetrahydrofolate cyclohydrolase [Rickettsiaceae bacterium]
MTKIIDGKRIADKILSDLTVQVANLSTKPTLAIISANQSEASKIYINNKIKAAKKIGIETMLLEYDKSVKTDEIESQIKLLNSEEAISGIIIQLPLYSHLDQNYILSIIDPKKDVDGLCPLNVGLLYSMQKPYHIPCTPLGILEILKNEIPDFTGLDIVIIGRSIIVGKPLAALLINQDSTVTICHSKSKDIQQSTLKADIVICASGAMQMFGRSYFNKNAILIDVGISRDNQGKVKGDIIFEEVKDCVRAITKVPGGVGPMTIAMLMSNIVKSAKNEFD